MVMSDRKSTEEQTQKIEAIVGDEALGYKGPAHGEHSGQDPRPEDDRDTNGLADNRPDQVEGRRS